MIKQFCPSKVKLYLGLVCTVNIYYAPFNLNMKLKSVLYDEDILSRTLKRIAHEILENTDRDKLCLIGIKTRGVPLANRLASLIKSIEDIDVPVGILDISPYRDDISVEKDKIKSDSIIDFDITGREVVITDDVIYTGRTARAALDAIMSFGRPSKIKLAAVVDRGHRELPIRPDFVGKNIPTSHAEAVKVLLKETDGRDVIELYEKEL